MKKIAKISSTTFLSESCSIIDYHEGRDKWRAGGHLALAADPKLLRDNEDQGEHNCCKNLFVTREKVLFFKNWIDCKGLQLHLNMQIKALWSLHQFLNETEFFSFSKSEENSMKLMQLFLLPPFLNYSRTSHHLMDIFSCFHLPNFFLSISLNWL